MEDELKRTLATHGIAVESVLTRNVERPANASPIH